MTLNPNSVKSLNVFLSMIANPVSNDIRNIHANENHYQIIFYCLISSCFINWLRNASTRFLFTPKSEYPTREAERTLR